MLFVHRFHDGEAFLDQLLPNSLYPVRLVTVTDKADALGIAHFERKRALAGRPLAGRFSRYC
ncbi:MULTISPECIES: hypothetical protein [unclassified Mesorhizobium]|uniref:hypothetical protein n=1 Tax=unclassified Mesorhizobium TaxID=325217 RepID=UPI00167BA1D6|nr:MULTISPECIES: hypothetical protein [unclassified Mesorhizobium]